MVPVELQVILVPLDRVEDVSLHLEVADEPGAVPDHPVRRDVDVV